MSKTADGRRRRDHAYMSPEQARGLPVDARTDIWSMGVILYEMIARKLPFPGQTASDRIAAILEREPEPLRKMRSEVPAGLERPSPVRSPRIGTSDTREAADFAEDLLAVRTRIGRGSRFVSRCQG